MAVQRLILVLDTSHRIDHEAFAQLHHGLQFFFDELKNHKALSKQLQVGVISYGMGVQVIQEPRRVTPHQAPVLYHGGYTTPEAAIAQAHALLSQDKGTHTPWLVNIGGPSPYPVQSLTDQVTALEWAMNLTDLHTLTVTTDGHQPHYLPIGEYAFQLRYQRYVQLFEWLLEAMDFHYQCQDDLPYTTAASWAVLEGFSVKRQDF